MLLCGLWEVQQGYGSAGVPRGHGHVRVDASGQSVPSLHVAVERRKEACLAGFVGFVWFQSSAILPRWRRSVRCERPLFQGLFVGLLAFDPSFPPVCFLSFAAFQRGAAPRRGQVLPGSP